MATRNLNLKSANLFLQEQDINLFIYSDYKDGYAYPHFLGHAPKHSSAACEKQHNCVLLHFARQSCKKIFQVLNYTSNKHQW